MVSNVHHLARLLATLSLLALAAPLIAQPELTAYYHAHVDPTRGGQGNVVYPDNANSEPWTFGSIRGAIEAILVESRRPTTPELSAEITGIVHVHQGIISPETNGEPLPIRMEDYIDVRGFGADKVSIQGFQEQLYNGPLDEGVFLPMGLEGGRLMLEVLVDFSRITTRDYAESLSNVTLRGGHVQVYVETEEAVNIAMHNCVFDMLHEPEDPDSPLLAEAGPVPGALFGVLSVAVWDEAVQDYRPPSFRFINNTVVMAWSAAGMLTTCRNGAVGICDVNDMLPVTPVGGTRGFDPDRRMRGVGHHMIVNSIFRTVPAQSMAATRAMIGIDNGETTVARGTRQTESNAFDRELVGNETGFGGDLPRYSSLVLGPFPEPWIDVNSGRTQRGESGLPNADPGFVGEFVNSTFASEGNSEFLRDWRLLPSSTYVEQGISPDADNLLAVANGVTYFPPLNESNAWRFDGEGYGNERIASSPKSPSEFEFEIDLGFDEASNMISALCRANDSVSYHRTSPRHEYPRLTGPAEPRRLFIVPDGGFDRRIEFYFRASELPDEMTMPWQTTSNEFWPTLGPPITVGTNRGYTNFYFDQTQAEYLSERVPAEVNYVAPFLGGAHSFGVVEAVSIIPNDLPIDRLAFLSIQGYVRQLFGPKIPTNVQNEIYAKPAILEILDGASAGNVFGTQRLWVEGDKLTSDVERLKTGGEDRMGVCADGVSRVLLRLTAGRAGVMNITGPTHPRDGVIGPPGGNLQHFPMTVPLVKTSEGFQAFVVYRGPQEYVSWTPDKFTGKRPIELDISYTPDQPGEVVERDFTLELHRPPVVFCHGLWSSPATWKGPFEALVTAGRVPGVSNPIFTPHVVDYSNNAHGAFETNAWVAREYPRKAVAEMRARDIACSQVDWVGHSMGGVLPRVAYRLGNSAFSPNRWNRDDNYHEGEINKLILLNSPQWGSALANLLTTHILNEDNPRLKKLNVANMAAIGMQAGEALRDLSFGSRAMRKIGKTKIPTHTIVGIGLKNAPVQLVNELRGWATALDIFSKWTTDPWLKVGSAAASRLSSGAAAVVSNAAGILAVIHGQEDHDLIVIESSQKTDLPGYAQTEIKQSVWPLQTMHTHVTGSQLGFDAVLNLLHEDMHAFAPEIPAPNLNAMNTHLASTTTPPLADGVRIVWINGGASVSPGQQITLEVIGQNGFTPSKADLFAAWGSHVLDTTPLRFSLTVPETAIGELLFGACGYDSAGNAAVTGDFRIPVNVAAQLNSMQSPVTDYEFFAPLETRQMTIVGSFSDNVERDITPPLTGTSYASSNPAVAAVTPEGRLVAVGDGEATITVYNSGTTASLQFPVTVDFGAVSTYGSCTQGTDGLWPDLSSGGQQPSIGNPDFGLLVEDVVGGSNGIVYVAGAAAVTDVGELRVLVDMTAPLAFPVVATAPVGSTGPGTATLPLPIPYDGNLIGVVTYYQAIFDDPNGPGGMSATNGLAVTVQQ